MQKLSCAVVLISLCAPVSLAMAQDASNTDVEGADAAQIVDAGQGRGDADPGQDSATVQDAAGDDAVVDADAAVIDAELIDTGVILDSAVAIDTQVQEDASAPADGALEDSSDPDVLTSDAALSAEDGGLESDAAELVNPCGDVDFIGGCDGDILRYCAQDNQIIELDCAAEFGDATCGLFDCTDPASCRGYACVARTGSACGELTCDVGAQEGCIQGLCAASDLCDPQDFEPSCDGDALRECAMTVNEVDCSQGGAVAAVCALDSDGVARCLGSLGAVCDPGSGRECAPDLICQASLCVDPNAQVDSGVVAVDASQAQDSGFEDSAKHTEDAGSDDSASEGCGCRAAGTTTAAPWLVLGVVGLLWRRRWRR